MMEHQAVEKKVHRTREIFPPKDPESRKRVHRGYDKLGHNALRGDAPWNKIHTNEKIDSLSAQLQEGASDFLAALGSFVNKKSDLPEGLNVADQILKGIIDGATPDEKKELEGAKHTALVLVLMRAYDTAEYRDMYRNRDLIPPKTRHVIAYATRYLQWETIASRKKGYGDLPNPWEKLIDLYNMGMSHFEFDSTSNSFKTYLAIDNASREISVPYPKR